MNFSLNQFKNEKLKSVFFILLGNTIFALAVAMFILPNELVSGGATGLALFMNRQYGIHMSVFLSIFNGILFLVGWVCLGKKFAITTALSTVYYPTILAVLQEIPGIGMKLNDKFLAVVFAGVLVGIGIGIVIKEGASTGGIDIPALILNKKIGIPVAVTLWTLDSIIIILQVISTERESILYGIVLIVVYTTIINRVLLVGKSQVQVKIVSTKYDEINDMILTKINRGSTLIRSQTGFQKEEGFMVLSVINNRELNRLNKLVSEIDPSAFMIISQVNEVKGKGFTLPKHM